jgi:hypothetical protein
MVACARQADIADAPCAKVRRSVVDHGTAAPNHAYVIMLANNEGAFPAVGCRHPGSICPHAGARSDGKTAERGPWEGPQRGNLMTGPRS